MSKLDDVVLVYTTIKKMVEPYELAFLAARNAKWMHEKDNIAPIRELTEALDKATEEYRDAQRVFDAFKRITQMK